MTHFVIDGIQIRFFNFNETKVSEITYFNFNDFLKHLHRRVGKGRVFVLGRCCWWRGGAAGGVLVLLVARPGACGVVAW